MSARYRRDPTPGSRPRWTVPDGPSTLGTRDSVPTRPNVIQRDPQPRRGWAERRVLGISLQMNMAPRSAVSPPGALVNVGMFAVTKCLENRILRASENPPSLGAAHGACAPEVALRLATSAGVARRRSSVGSLRVRQAEPGERDGRKDGAHRQEYGRRQHNA
jgi:hypothetical protein